jgi:hypothetical protein
VLVTKREKRACDVHGVVAAPLTRESFQLGANMQLDIRRTLLPSVHPQYISVT